MPSGPNLRPRGLLNPVEKTVTVGVAEPRMTVGLEIADAGVVRRIEAPARSWRARMAGRDLLMAYPLCARIGSEPRVTRGTGVRTGWEATDTSTRAEAVDFSLTHK